MSLMTRIEELKDEKATMALLDKAKEIKTGKLIECLDDGFVHLVESMGNDDSIIRAARVSYGQGTKRVSEDRHLIRYLMRHYHTTPFEMVEFIFHVRVPMDCWRQWVRHRTASINEYSTRYSEAIDSAQESEAWRMQSTNNKQGSCGTVTEWPEGWRVEVPHGDDSFSAVVLNPQGQAMMLGHHPYPPSEYLSARERKFHQLARSLYDERLEFGVAREVARKDLPLSTYTEAYWKCDLHNLLHFLRLRMDSHAQLEIRTFANAIGRLVKSVVPYTWEAFEDYRLNAMHLTGPDIQVLLAREKGQCWMLAAEQEGMGKREIDELMVKAERIGIVLKKPTLIEANLATAC